MFLTINAETFRNEWVAYKLTDAAGEIITVDITRYSELTSLPGTILPATGTVYLAVMDQDVDRLRLANRFMSTVPAKFQWVIRDVVARWGREGSRKNGAPITCVETGETWSSATQCAEENNLTYSQLVKHLKGAVGYKSVKGRTYKKL